MGQKTKNKCEVLFLSDTAGKQQYKKLVNDPAVTVNNMTKHWEGGDCIALIEYEEKVHEQPSEIPGKTNGIPSNINSNCQKIKKKELEEDSP